MRIHTMKTSRFRQLGLSLAEMLIGLVVGLIVVGIVGTLFITTLRGSDDTLRAMKLNQELRAAMNYMANDIRRAGFWAVAATEDNTNYPNRPYDNPFTVRTVADVATDVFVDNNCIMYSYDDPENTDNTTIPPYNDPLPRRFAFRLTGTSIEVPQSNLLGTGTDDACAEGTWEDLTDPNAVNISQLAFSFEGSRCENLDKLETVGGVTRPTSWQIPVQAAQGAAYDPALVKTTPACFDTGATGYPTGALVPVNGDRLVETRQVRIVLTGNHVKDPTVTLTLDETIKIPNNRAVIFPGP